MYGNSIYNHPRIDSFDTAARVFKDTPRVRSARWNQYERPIYKTYTAQYVLRQQVDASGNVMYYDLVLYGTTLVRYLAPQHDGYTVLVRGYASNMSWKMLHHHGWGHYKKYPTLDGRTVRAPLSTTCTDDYTENGVTVPAKFSAVLVFKHDSAATFRIPTMQLDTAASMHRPFYVRRSSDADIEMRVTVLKHLAPVLDAAMFRIPAMHDAVGSVYKNARIKNLFTPALDFRTKKVVADLVDRVLNASDSFTLRESDVAFLLDVASNYYESRIFKRRYSVGYEETFDEIRAIDAVQFREGFVSLLMRTGRLSKQSLKVQLPPFMTELPKKAVW